ncbi:hypothetical protein ACJX0J_037200, partial [Zea mays]
FKTKSAKQIMSTKVFLCGLAQQQAFKELNAALEKILLNINMDTTIIFLLEIGLNRLIIRISLRTFALLLFAYGKIENCIIDVMTIILLYFKILLFRHFLF